nr:MULTISPECIES: potassium transporter TrkG [Lachnospiraceae]
MITGLYRKNCKFIFYVNFHFCRACAGSTGGGFKISRLLILCKAIPKQLSLVIHPREVKVIRMDGKPIDHNTLRSTNVYLAIYFFILLVSTLLISVDNFNLTTNFTAVASTLNNIGPGLDGVGPTRNFGMYSDFSKFVLMFDMLAGRLELYPLLILFMPSLWRRK